MKRQLRATVWFALAASFVGAVCGGVCHAWIQLPWGDALAFGAVLLCTAAGFLCMGGLRQHLVPFAPRTIMHTIAILGVVVVVLTALLAGSFFTGSVLLGGNVIILVDTSGSMDGEISDCRIAINDALTYIDDSNLLAIIQFDEVIVYNRNNQQLSDAELKPVVDDLAVTNSSSDVSGCLKFAMAIAKDARRDCDIIVVTDGDDVFNSVRGIVEKGGPIRVSAIFVEKNASLASVNSGITKNACAEMNGVMVYANDLAALNLGFKTILTRSALLEANNAFSALSFIAIILLSVLMGLVVWCVYGMDRRLRCLLLLTPLQGACAYCFLCYAAPALSAAFGWTGGAAGAVWAGVALWIAAPKPFFSYRK